MYWSGTLRIILESYTILAICSFINFTDLTFDTYGTSIMSFTAICAMVFTTIFPFAVYVFLFKNYELIKSGDELFEQRFGALWEGIKINEQTEDKTPLLYIFWFLFRRYLLGILAVLWKNYFIYQITGMIASGIIGAIIVGYSRPLETRLDNDLEYFNETAIIFMVYCSMCFTDWQPNEDVQYQTGWAMIVFDGLHLAVNFFLLFQSTFRLAKMKITRWRLWRKFAKVRGERMYQNQKVARHKQWIINS